MGGWPVGWLVVEDLATVLFLVILPFLKGGDSVGEFAQDAGVAIAKAAVFLAVGLIAGTRPDAAIAQSRGPHRLT